MSTFYTKSEELFHAVTHGLGAVLATAGAGYLVARALEAGDPWRVASVTVYGATLVLLYTASALYHGVRPRHLKARLRVLDHSAIYLLIAGSYTPFLLLRLWGPWGWTLLGIVWGMALAGIVYKVTLLDRFPHLSTMLYLGMAWMGLLAGLPLLRALSPTTLAWLLAGGVIYTAGTAIYHLERVRYAHVVWHMFVLAGSFCHFVAIARL